jgi:hypothetical protein
MPLYDTEIYHIEVHWVSDTIPLLTLLESVYFYMVGGTGFEPVNGGFKIHSLRPDLANPHRSEFYCRVLAARVILGSAR